MGGRKRDWSVASLEAEWARGGGGNLDLKMRNRVAGLLLGARNWADLSMIVGVSQSTVRREELGLAHRRKIVELVNTRVRPKSEIDLKEFEKRRADGSTPVASFHRWLGDARPPRRASYGRLLPPDTSEHPEERMTGVMAFLGRADLRMVKVVHQAGMTEGLRALAAHLIFEALPADDELKWRNVCYLPVTRDQDFSRITFPRLVRDLHAFYCPNAAPIDAPDSAQALRDALAAVRAAMMTDPAILILDGHIAYRGALAEARALVSDDALTALLRETLHPLLGHDAAPQDGNRFYENRLLILADRDLPDLQPFADKPLRLAPLPVDRMSKVLQLQGRTNIDELLDIYRDERMTSDAAMALADTVISLRLCRFEAAKAEPTRRMLIEGLTTPDEAYNQLVAELRLRGDPIALFALRLVAVTDGGLRDATLVRLVDQWRKVAPDLGPDFALPEVTLAQVRLRLAVLRPILLRGLDAPIPGLDEMAEPYVYLDEVEAQPLKTPTRLRVMDLRSAQLRESIIGELVEVSEVPQAFVLMHRLLAEEGLRQQTRAMLHAEWRGSADIGYYRRLVQALFHGFASLSMGWAHAAPGASAAPAVLPENPTSAYRRLYAVFFRTLLEHPPHFDLSRSLGRDGLKAELILLAQNADRPPREIWAQMHGDGPRFTPRRSAYLETSVAELCDRLVKSKRGAALTSEQASAEAQRTAESNLRLVLDQNLSLARAAYQADRLPEADLAYKEADRLLKSNLAKTMASALDTERLRAAKVNLDIQIQYAPLGQVTTVSGILADAGFDQPRLAALRALQGCTADAASSADAEKRLYERANAFVLVHCTGLAAATLADWSDLLCRLGEVEAMEADNLPTVGREFGRFRALITFYLAERMRREAFDRDPLGRTFVVNAHSTRVLVRTSLQLVRALHAARTEVKPMPSGRYFVMLARRHLDLLTRYSARYPSERPSLLVLEATFTRSVGGHNLEKLLAALKLLDEADRLSFTTPDRPRVRRRLILERAKVFRALLTTSGEATAEIAVRGARILWWNRAASDVVRLWRLTTGATPPETATTLWERAIADQAESLRSIARTNRYHPGGARGGFHVDDWEALNKIPQIARRRA